MAEIRATWRVYCKEWLHDSNHATEEEGLAHFNRKWKGRLVDEDWRVAQNGSGLWQLQVRRWNVAGEWKHVALADDHKKLLEVDRGLAMNDVVVVERNARAEHALTQYGHLPLRDGSHS